MSAASHRDIPAAHALVRRLCALQAHVVTEVLGYDDPADCFCGDEGLWPYADPDDYRNAGKAVEFIETATLEAIRQHGPAVWTEAFQRDWATHQPCAECRELGCATNGEPCSCECRHGAANSHKASTRLLPGVRVGLIGGRAELERYWRDDMGTQSYLTKDEAAALLAYIDELETRLHAACDPCSECGHTDYRDLDSILECSCRCHMNIDSKSSGSHARAEEC